MFILSFSSPPDYRTENDSFILLLSKIYYILSHSFQKSEKNICNAAGICLCKIVAIVCLTGYNIMKEASMLIEKSNFQVKGENSPSDKNINRRSYARSYFCALVIMLIIILILAFTVTLAAVTEAISSQF